MQIGSFESKLIWICILYVKIMKNWLLDFYCSKNMKKEGLLGHAIAEECELNNFHFKEVLFLIFFRGGKRGGKTSVRGGNCPPLPPSSYATAVIQLDH